MTEKEETWEDVEEHMLYCTYCTSPLLYATEELKEVRTQGNNDVVRMEWERALTCATCGREVASWYESEDFSPPSMVKAKCLDCKKEYEKLPGMLPICEECREKYAGEGGYVELA